MKGYYFWMSHTYLMFLFASITLPTTLSDQYSFLFESLLKPSTMRSIDFDDPQIAVHIVKFKRNQSNKEIFVFTETPHNTVLCHVPFDNLIALQFIIFDHRARCSILDLNKWKLLLSISPLERIQKVFSTNHGEKLVVNFAPNKSVIIDFMRKDCYLSDKYHFLTSFNATLIIDGTKNSYFIMKPSYYKACELDFDELTVPYVEMEYGVLDHMGDRLLVKIHEGYFVWHREHNMLDLLVTYHLSETGRFWTPFEWSTNLSGFISKRILYLFYPTTERNYIIICPTDDSVKLVGLKPNEKRRCLVRRLSTFLLTLYVDNHWIAMNTTL